MFVRGGVWFRWKDVYGLLGEIQKTCFLARTTVILPYIHLRTWLVITVVFVSSIFESSCVICLVSVLEKLKLNEHRGCYWRKKLLWMIFEEQFPVPRYTVASKIGNSVISLLWQLRCLCNPDHDKFSSSSNTTVVPFFPKLCLWRRSLCSNLRGIGPKKLYRATLRWAYQCSLIWIQNIKK